MAKRAGCVRYIGHDIVDMRSGRCRKLASNVDRCITEIETGDCGAQPGQRKRVGADVTLQMDDIGEMCGVASESIQSILRARSVKRDALLPVLVVDPAIIGATQKGLDLMGLVPPVGCPSWRVHRSEQLTARERILGAGYRDRMI